MKKCPECDKPVYCGAETGQTCWCGEFPPIVPVDNTKQCLCKDCLRKHIVSTINLFVQEYRLGKRENIAPLYPTGQPMKGIDYYLENGFRVMTEWYHLKRGYCCKNGCRHCPYGFKNRTE